MSNEGKKALLLSVGYGQGHHAAAHALAEELQERGWVTRVADPCAMAHPRLFALTQQFYHLCVRRAPWLWGVTYAQTDTADWASMVHMPLLRECMATVRQLLMEESPDMVYCTYPLFAYMLDALRDEEGLQVPYAMVVTDALEISRPWMLSRAPLVFVTDEASRQMVMTRYGLEERRIVAAGFPVRRAFAPHPGRKRPDRDNLRLVYGAFAPPSRVEGDVRQLLARFPGAFLTLLAGERQSRFAGLEAEGAGRVRVLDTTDEMASLFAESHFYIGKAGAATLFEAYASHLPVIVNYTLPGQEQGNLALLLQDGAGLVSETTPGLVLKMDRMLEHDAAGWRRLCAAMKEAARGGAAARIADETERRFFS